MPEPDLTPFGQAEAKLAPRRAPVTEAVTVNLDKGEATFDARPGEAPAVALERLVRDLWHDVDAPTLRILQVVEVTMWGNPDAPFKRFKAKVVDDPKAGVDDRDLLAIIRRARPSRRPKPVATLRDLNVVLSDWQVGKAGEAGGGTPELCARIDAQLGQLEDLVRDLRKVGRPISRINLLKGGDLVDQCFGFGPVGKQLWTNDRNLTEQLQIGWELDVKVHRVAARLAGHVRSYAVASNHGQPRLNGGQATDDGDSYDLFVHHATGRLLGQNLDAYGHVEVLLPQDPLVAQLDSHGVRIGLAHGHQAGGGGRPVYKMWEWWKGQDFGRQSDVDIMVVGHFHHPYLVSQAGRTLLGAPANDGGSRWLTSSSGEWAAAGTLAFTTSADGWGDYTILDGGAA